ncbi:hypothetical protein [Haliangium sp. UPWRP_2]|uniref:hypothetical protein n=1 Tax=Haliangium sp. UPWRP_2 TaxID=1931276 RepID=UPI000B548B9C|nr:hypothetical protein [Haliangium sp. UPWRP_2]HNN94885.1 hypothetical protein [Pseudomonadota bacterium]
MSRFSDQALRRYSRQILLREVGGRGQEKIGRARLILIAGPSGGSLASVAAQYLLRAGVAEVGWYAEADATAGPLLALAAAEELTWPAAEAITASSEGRLLRGAWSQRPPVARQLGPGVRCLAAWAEPAGHSPWSVVGGRCERGLPLSAGPAPTKRALHTEPLDAEALSLGSALALGLLRELLGWAGTPQAGKWDMTEPTGESAG